MKLLTEQGSIANAIRQIRPTHIVTGFIGGGWERYVDSKRLQSIIVSTMPGSSAEAIRSLEQRIGWKKIHFHDRVHAKFYWSEGGAVVGSSNLSENGLRGVGGLIEVAVLLECGIDDVALAGLKAYHDSLRRDAAQSYPTARDKTLALNRLCSQTAHIPREHSAALGVLGGLRHRREPYRGLPISKFEYAEYQGRIHIVGWHDEPKLDRDKLMRQLGRYEDSKVNFAEDNYIAFKNDDAISIHDWILTWETTKHGVRAKPSGDIAWLLVDAFTTGVVTSPGWEDWSKLAHQTTPIHIGNVPFVLDANVKRQFRKLIQTRQFDGLRAHGTDSEAWSLAAADGLVERFLVSLKSKCTCSSDAHDVLSAT